VTGLTFVALLQVSLITGVSDYAEARKELVETGRPMVVLLGADWCTGCIKMKQSITPEVARRGGFKNVEFVQINTEANPRLARAMMVGGSIPQLVMYRKTSKGWRRSRLIGAQSATRVEKFIQSGLKDSVKTKVAKKETDSETK